MIKSNLRLTVRDIELLKDIYDSQFLSFYQVHETHFPENKRPTVYNRLSKLVKAEIIKAVNVNIVAHHRKGELLGVVYLSTKEGLRWLQDYKMTEDINPNPVTLNLSCLYHDLLLNDVLTILKGSWKVTKPSKENQNRIPDAVLVDPRTNKKMALQASKLSLLSSLKLGLKVFIGHPFWGFYFLLPANFLGQKVR